MIFKSPPLTKHFDSTLYVNAFAKINAQPKLRKFLEEYQVETPYYYKDFPDVIDKALKDNKNKVLTKEKLINFLYQVKLLKNKSIRIIDLSDFDIAEISKSILKNAKKKNQFEVVNFPLEEDESKINALRGNYETISSNEDEDYLSLILTSARPVKTRLELSEEYITKEAPSFIQEAEKFYIINDIAQVIDAIIIFKKLKCAVLLYECPTSGGLNDIDSKINFLQHYFASLFNEGVQLSAFNLHPIIRPIYNDKKEGKIRELIFECSTGVSRREFKRVGIIDLRSEKYHKGGTESLYDKSTGDPGSFIIFGISIIWDEIKSLSPSITIKSTKRKKSLKFIIQQGFLPEFAIEDELEFIVKKLCNYLHKRK